MISEKTSSLQESWVRSNHREKPGWFANVLSLSCPPFWSSFSVVFECFPFDDSSNDEEKRLQPQECPSLSISSSFHPFPVPLASNLWDSVLQHRHIILLCGFDSWPCFSNHHSPCLYFSCKFPHYVFFHFCPFVSTDVNRPLLPCKFRQSHICEELGSLGTSVNILSDR